MNRRVRPKDGMVQYLVKWMDLTYADATWEDEDEDIPDLLNYIRDYEDLRLVWNYIPTISIYISAITNSEQVCVRR